jgi:hypothetical protein
MNRALLLLPALQAPANSGASASRIDFACDLLANVDRLLSA